MNPVAVGAGPSELHVDAAKLREERLRARRRRADRRPRRLAREPVGSGGCRRRSVEAAPAGDAQYASRSVQRRQAHVLVEEDRVGGWQRTSPTAMAARQLAFAPNGDFPVASPMPGAGRSSEPDDDVGDDPGRVGHVARSRPPRHLPPADDQAITRTVSVRARHVARPRRSERPRSVRSRRRAGSGRRTRGIVRHRAPECEGAEVARRPIEATDATGERAAAVRTPPSSTVTSTDVHCRHRGRTSTATASVTRLQPVTNPRPARPSARRPGRRGSRRRSARRPPSHRAGSGWSSLGARRSEARQRRLKRWVTSRAPAASPAANSAAEQSVCPSDTTIPRSVSSPISSRAPGSSAGARVAIRTPDARDHPSIRAVSGCRSRSRG